MAAQRLPCRIPAAVAAGLVTNSEGQRLLMMVEIAPNRVDADTVMQWLADPDSVMVLDVRSPAEFETAHVAGSYNVPLALLGEHAGQLAARLDRKVVLVCQSGVRAAQAQQQLHGVGAEHLHVLAGGVPSFLAAGGQVVTGRSRWSMERQVRMVAGTLVLASAAAGFRAPRLGLVAGGVGAGLAVSAATNTCTMGRILAALPYNRGPRHLSVAELLEQLPRRQPAG